MNFNPESLWWQYLGLFGVVIANAYADGLIVRSLILPLTNAVNSMFREMRQNKAFFVPSFPNWKPWQWLWHILKWVYFNGTLFYVLRFCWHWPFGLIGLAGIAGFVVWTIVYRWDALYGKALEP